MDILYGYHLESTNANRPEIHKLWNEKNMRLQYFYDPDVHQVSNRNHVVDLPSDIMIRRDPLVFPTALLR